ncbi:hypothetical protein APHAL10511_003568 [Amanita phalloides]|nr:hypothetical protein APHAL10511_003568 [Amanita phalloides]
MIERSNCSLSHLTIEDNGNAIDVGALLANIPGLRLLMLDQARFDQDTLDRLAQGQLGPDLEHFTVREPDGVSPQELRNIIEKRLGENSKEAPFI